MEYTLGLALEDYVPVILSSIGMWLLSQMIAQVNKEIGQLALVGWLLISLGGLSKATWKLIMSLSNGTQDIVMLDNLLFILLGPGFVFMTYALWCAYRIVTEKSRPGVWVVPVGITAVFTLPALFTAFTQPDSRIWFFILLAMTTLGNLGLGILLIRQSLFLKRPWIAVLFGINLVTIFMLSGMARIPDQTIPLQWTEQIVNTLSQGAFAFASWQLAKVMVQTAVSTNMRKSMMD